MQWSDSGIILSARRHGETSVIVDLLTRDHGRHAGMVRGGRGKRYRPVLQLGNKVEADWKARLSEHLGMYVLEPVRLRAAMIMDDGAKLLALQSVCALAGLVAEREPHPGLFEATDLMINALAREEHWQPLLVVWELGLLSELGFGLDLMSCAASGETDDLVYVSPKSGCAVSAGAGEPYKDRLFSLPPFLLPGMNREQLNVVVDDEDLRAGLQLTGYFLEKYLFAPNGEQLPGVRQRLIGYFRGSG